jgi:hypothetical protein
VRDARPYRQSARTVLKISQTDRQPPGGMPPTCDSMDKGPGAFFARQTIENEADFVGPEEFLLFKDLRSKAPEQWTNHMLPRNPPSS